MHPPERRPHSIDSQSSADKIAWRKIRKALEEIGISALVFEASKESIMRRLLHAIETGALEERYAPDTESGLPLESESAPGNNINSATSNASSTELGPATEHHNFRSQIRQTKLCAAGSECEITPTNSLQVASLRSLIYVELPSLPLPYSPEPSVSCKRCGKFNIAFELHMRCQEQCSNGNFDICLRCWRLGRGCLNWYGFGESGTDRWISDVGSKTGEHVERTHPHYLTGRRYRRVTVRKPPTDQDDESVLIETSDPSGNIQLQSGHFCSICSTFVQRYLMICDICNGGEWTYCIACVNQGRCCTHPLLPVSLSTYATSSNSRLYEETREYYPLTFSSHCNNCALPIALPENRYHCPECNNGDYDLCTSCYLGLVKSGQISEANGPQGWRRCLKDHRMIVTAFEKLAKYQQRNTVTAFELSTWYQHRVIVEDLVGGHALGHYLPSGGLDSCFLALYSSWPNEEDHDELAFPKGAEIREVQDHNGGWFSGFYCGKGGLFAGNLGTKHRRSRYRLVGSKDPSTAPENLAREPQSLDTAKGSEILPYRHRPTPASNPSPI